MMFSAKPKNGRMNYQKTISTQTVGHKKPNEKRNYLTVIEDGMSNFSNLESESSLVVARNILLDRAILEAKANIITSLYANFSADTYTDFLSPGLRPLKKYMIEAVT